MKTQRWLLLLLILTIALTAAQCGASPSQEPPVVEEQSAPATTEANEAEASADESAANAAEEEAQKAVQESNVSQAKSETGITVASDEPDVSTLRTKLGGDYRDVAISDAVSFHIYQTTDAGSSGYQGLVFSGSLITLNEKTLEYEPYAAESFSVSEDGLTFTFKLRKDLKWSDGTPLTANDYVWTYEQAMKPENGYPYLDQFNFVTSYKALDDHTLELKIDKMYCPALGQIDFITPLPKHIWEKLDWDDPETNPEINNPTVTSGPYKLQEWNRDQFASFEANENYWYHGPPNISKQTIEIVPDQDVAYQKFKNGESDTAPITPEQLEEARQLDNASIYEWWPAAARWAYIGLNMREGFPTHDINVRHALSYALDKDLLTEEIMLGQAKRLCSAYPETSWIYNPDIPCYDYDVEKAKEEFAKAGYTFQDGKLLDKEGQQLKLKLIYGPNTSKVLELLAVSVQDYLAEIGVELEIQALEWASFLEAQDKGEWDMYLGAWRSTIEPQAMFLIWSEEGIPDLNAVAYINKDVEKLFNEAGGDAGTCDLDFRKEKYQEIQKILAEESPYIFLWYQKAWSGQNKRIQGIEPTLLGIGWNQEEWYIEDKLE